MRGGLPASLCRALFRYISTEMRGMSKTVIFRVVVAALAVSVAFCGGVFSYAMLRTHDSKADAERLLQDLLRLQVRQSSLSQMNDIANRHSTYHRSLLKPIPPACDSKNDPCYFDFAYDNSFLAHLHLASSVLFGVRVQIHNQRVDAIMVDLTCGEAPNVTGIVLNEGVQTFTDRTIEISPFSNTPSLLWVRLTPNSPERNQAYSLKLELLDHLGRCPSKHDLMTVIGIVGLSR